ncbi:cupin domain-containing protein [Candidatus Kaiserbacteria bacterium]|nr:MAG: cupin domain-containing protein [Candidatus Kaiserbacteria bacterium]
MKKGYKTNIEEETVSNTNFRKVLYTGEYSQLVLMTLAPSEDIGLEIHADTDQFFRFEAGEGKVIINETEHVVKDGDAVVVPAGSQHNVMNTSNDESLHFYTIYSPAHHKDQTVHQTKANQVEEHFDGVTSE